MQTSYKWSVQLWRIPSWAAANDVQRTLNLCIWGCIVTKHIWHKSATFINTDPTFLCLVFTVLALTSVATTASTWYNASNYKSIVPNKWRNYSRKSVLFFHLVIYRESDSKILQSKILPKLEETAARHSGQRSRWRCFCKFCNLSGSTPRPAKVHQNPLRKGANAWI